MDDLSDFPAAHSMDTGWFGVDRDGHVALFSTGETGPVPDDASGDLDELLARLRRRPETTPWREALVERGGGEHRTLDIGTTKTLLYLRAAEPTLPEVIATARATRVPTLSADEQAILVEDIAPELFERLHREGRCLGCTSDYGPSYYDEAAQLGVFVYDHAYGSRGYYRELTPSQPLRVDALPAELRAELERVRFRKVCFSEAGWVQPVGAVRTWDGDDYYRDDDDGA